MNGPATGGCGFLRPEEIDRLLAGNLSGERREAFRAHRDDGCLECAFLAADLEGFRRVVEEGVTDDERALFQAQSEMLGRRLRKEVSNRVKKSRGPGSIYRILPAAAAFFLLAIGLVAVLRGPGLPGSTVRLPDGESRQVEVMAFHAPPTVRGEAADAGRWLQSGEAYARGDYEEAEELLSQIEPGGAGEIDAALYRGICLHMTGQYEAALGSFDRAMELAEEDDLPASAIAWFRALTLLALNDTKSARESLETARDSGGAYADDAADLLERLEP